MSLRWLNFSRGGDSLNIERLFFAVFILLLQLPQTVTARFETSNPRPLTGQPFMLAFVAVFPPGTEAVELPTFPATWGEFEVRDVGQVTEETQPDGTKVYRQQLTVVLWQPRDFNTPDTYVSYRVTGLNETLQIPVQKALVTVPTVLDFENLALKPFKPLIYLPYLSPLLVIGGIAVTGGVIGYGYYRWKQRPAPTPFSVPEYSPSDLALQMLDVINTNQNLTPSEQYAAVANVLRVYLQSQYEVVIATTPETVETLRGQVSEIALAELQRLLGEADLVKFAAVQPDAEATRRMIELAKRWIIRSIDEET
jgi:hypothetical protein